MRTTIILDDHLGERLREEARRRRQSFSAFLAEAGRKALDEKGTTSSDEGFRLITYGKSGIVEGVNLDRTGTLMVADDEERYRA